VCAAAWCRWGAQVIAQIWVLLLGGLALSFGLDKWAGHETPVILGLATFGSLVSYIYSAPPLKVSGLEERTGARVFGWRCVLSWSGGEGLDVD
jgi:4-hydroxybenzoate polyprenyltransferase